MLRLFFWKLSTTSRAQAKWGLIIVGKFTYYWHQLFVVVNPTVERVETPTDRKDGTWLCLSFEVSDSDAASISEEVFNIDMPKAKNAEDF